MSNYPASRLAKCVLRASILAAELRFASRRAKRTGEKKLKLTKIPTVSSLARYSSMTCALVNFSGAHPSPPPLGN